MSLCRFLVLIMAFGFFASCARGLDPNAVEAVTTVEAFLLLTMDGRFPEAHQTLLPSTRGRVFHAQEYDWRLPRSFWPYIRHLPDSFLIQSSERHGDSAVVSFVGASAFDSTFSIQNTAKLVRLGGRWQIEAIQQKWVTSPPPSSLRSIKPVLYRTDTTISHPLKEHLLAETGLLRALGQERVDNGNSAYVSMDIMNISDGPLHSLQPILYVFINESIVHVDTGPLISSLVPGESTAIRFHYRPPSLPPYSEWTPVRDIPSYGTAIQIYDLHGNRIAFR